MNPDELIKPASVNKDHFTTNTFPSIIAFCDRDDTTHIVNGDEESYSYKLQNKVIYTVKKKAGRFEVIEFDGEKAVKVSTDTNLGEALAKVLTFGPGDVDRQTTRTNILIPVEKKDSAKAVALMYYLGGYPVSSEPKKSELMEILEKFEEPDLDFLVYSHVPVEYIPWLQIELKEAGIVGQSITRKIWPFKM